MSTVNYKVGMLVDHPNRPAWGPGKIVHVDASRIHVFFRDSLERKAKTIVYSVVPLVVAGSQTDAVLDALPDASHEAGAWMLPANFGPRAPKAPKSKSKAKPQAVETP